MRNIERGSNIVRVVADKLIFQLPRGNLEVIYPRLTVIKQAKANFKNSSKIMKGSSAKRLRVSGSTKWI